MGTGIDKEDLPILINTIRQFRIAISNMRLYPTESEVVQTSLKNLYDAISTFLNKYKFMTLGFVEGKPIVNKEDISKGLPESVKPGVFLERLNEHNIKTVTFRYGIEFNELQTFLELLKQKYDSSHTLQDGLKHAKVKKIGVNEKIYTAIGDKDLVIERGEEILSKSKGAIDKVLSQVEKIVDMTLSVENPSLREKLKLEIGKKLLFKDPALIEKLVGKSGTQESIGANTDLTREELEEHLGNIIETFRLCKKENVDEVRDRLKELTRSVASMLRKVDPAFSLSKGLFEHIEELDDFSKKWEKLSVKDMTSEEEKLAKKILSQSSFDMLHQEGVERAIDALAERGLWGFAFKIIKKLILGFDSVNPATRSNSLKRLSNVINTVFMNASAKEFYFVYLNTLKVLLKETSPDVFDSLIDVLPIMSQKAWERGLKNEVVKSLSFISMEIKSPKTSKERREKLIALRKKMAINLRDALFDRVVSLQETDPYTLKAIYHLGDEIARDLVNFLKGTDEKNIQGKISRLLSSLGNSAEEVIISEISVEQDPDKLNKLMGVIGEFKNRNEVIDALKVALRSAGTLIKPVIFEKLVELSASGLEDFALEFTESEDPNVQELGFEYLLENEPDKVREKVDHLLIPKKVLFLKFQQQSFIKVKRRIIELIGEQNLLWGIPMVIPQLVHQDRTIKKAAYTTLIQFKPEIIRRYEKDIKQLSKSKDPLAKDYIRKLLDYMS